MQLAGSAFAHSDSKWTKGPQGGHIVDAGGGKQHWELVAKGNELTLYVSTPTRSRSMSKVAAPRARCLLGGKTYNVDFKPAGEQHAEGNRRVHGSQGHAA